LLFNYVNHSPTNFLQPALLEGIEEEAPASGLGLIYHFLPISSVGAVSFSRAISFSPGVSVATISRRVRNFMQQRPWHRIGGC
jgi:hypothetical protein